MEVQTGEMAKCTPSSLPAIETLELDGLLETSRSSFIFSMVFASYVMCKTRGGDWRRLVTTTTRESCRRRALGLRALLFNGFCNICGGLGLGAGEGLRRRPPVKGDGDEPGSSEPLFSNGVYNLCEVHGVGAGEGLRRQPPVKVVGDASAGSEP